MNFSLISHMPFFAETRQYHINGDASVRLTLFGPNSYCDLKAIKNLQLKEILAKVGNAFEKKACRRFFNVSHTFTPTEATDSKGNPDPNDQVNECLDNQVKDIFAFAMTAIAEQTDGNLVLDLTDMTRLVVRKAEDHVTFLKPLRAYELGITISKKAIEAAKKTGLVFQEYHLPLPTDEPARFLGIGQSSSF